MRNPFRRKPRPLIPDDLSDAVMAINDRPSTLARLAGLTSDERYADDAMPADWPAFTADLFERPAWPDRPAVDGPVMWDATTGTVTPLPDRIEAWEHVDAVLAEHPVDDTVRDYEWGADGGIAHPAVIDLRRALDPLEAHEALMRTRAQEDIAYAEGRAVRTLGLGDIGALFDAEQHMDNREHGARLAALVLAGYTGTPRELVR